MLKTYIINGKEVTLFPSYFDRVNDLARTFYGMMGYEVEKGFDFSKSNHPQEKLMFNQALVAYAFDWDDDEEEDED